MIRAVELSLFLAPVVLYAVWLWLGRTGRIAPSRHALLALLAGLVVMGLGLAWSGIRERHPEGSQYVPAQMQNGQIVPGHGV